MAQWVGLVSAVVGWVLGLGSSFGLERFRSRVTLRGGARLLVADLQDAQEQLAVAGGDAAKQAAAIDRAHDLWHTYRGDLARGLGNDDWEIVSLLMRFVWRMTDARNVDT